MIGTILGALVFGLILGPLGRLLAPGKQQIGILWTILAGAAAALVGGLIADGVGLSDTANNIDWLRIIIQVVLAIIAVIVVARWKGRSSEDSAE